MSSKINLQTCEYACKSSIFQDNQLIFHKHKKDYDVFQVRKCGIESLKNTIEIPDIVEERIAMVYEEILKKGNMRRK